MHNYDNRNHYKIANIISFNRNYVKNGGKKKRKKHEFENVWISGVRK